MLALISIIQYISLLWDCQGNAGQAARMLNFSLIFGLTFLKRKTYFLNAEAQCAVILAAQLN